MAITTPDDESKERIERVEVAEQPIFARAFQKIESKVYDITLAARLAKAQLERATDEVELKIGAAEILKMQEVDLAVHAVASLLERAQAFENHWLELHGEACRAGHAAADTAPSAADHVSGSSARVVEEARP
jgi:hypothetical protein